MKQGERITDDLSSARLRDLLPAAAFLLSEKELGVRITFYFLIL